jgi:hypothetical protein
MTFRKIWIASLLGGLMIAQIQDAGAVADNGGTKKFHREQGSTNSQTDQLPSCSFGAVAVQAPGGEWHC